MSPARDDGFTLVEVLVALAILTAAVATIVAALGTAGNTSDRHRKQAQDEVVVRAWAEALEGAAYQTTCTTAVSTSYTAATLAVTIPTGYVVTAPVVTTLAGGACANGLSLQKVTIGVRSGDTRATTTLDVVKYKP
jgi:prepilin-type N-terminal cleavage/methylation domain-containing protein